MALSANDPGYRTGPYDSASMSAVSTVFDAFDRAAGAVMPVESTGTAPPPGASSPTAGRSSTTPAPGSFATGGGAGDGAARGATRLPAVPGGDGDGLSHTVESRVYNEERHVVDINVALPAGTRLRQQGSAHGVTIHTGYGTAKP